MGSWVWSVSFCIPQCCVPSHPFASTSQQSRKTMRQEATSKGRRAMAIPQRDEEGACFKGQAAVMWKAGSFQLSSEKWLIASERKLTKEQLSHGGEHCPPKLRTASPPGLFRGSRKVEPWEKISHQWGHPLKLKNTEKKPLTERQETWMLDLFRSLIRYQHQSGKVICTRWVLVTFSVKWGGLRCYPALRRLKNSFALNWLQKLLLPQEGDVFLKS